MDQRLLRILGGATEHYPYALESRYPRILKKIMALWDDEAIDGYFLELMVGERSDRSGFPPDVAADILHLSLVHAAHDDPEKQKGIWDAPSESFVNFAARQAKGWADTADTLKTELQKYKLPCTPEGLFNAAETGHSAAVALFIEAKTDTETRDNRGWTPLMIAAFRGHDEIVGLLIQHNACVNALDSGGNSALHWAAFGGHAACIKQLIQNHAQIDARNHFGWTPLLQATARNHPDAVALLIDSGVNLDTAADDGYTALHKAAALGYIEIVQLLLNRGASKNLKTGDGDTPLSLATKNRQQAVMTLLMPDPDSTA